jgi:cell division septation protein DedD
MRKGWFAAAYVAALMVMTVPANAGGHVYALRGLINVFSYGMDDMVAKCKRRGIQASAHGHGEYQTLATEAAAKVKAGKGPIIIIGHSYGADAAVGMAAEMNKLGAPVALLVLYGPTVEPLHIPANVRAVMNYYQTSNAAWRARAVPGPGFRGSINNINLDKDPDVTHFNIEKLERLQNQAMTRIVGITGTGRPINDGTTTTATASTGNQTTARPSAPRATAPASAPANPSATASATTASAPAAAKPASAPAAPASTTGTSSAATPAATPAAAPKPKPKPAPRAATTAPVDRLPSHGMY